MAFKIAIEKYEEAYGAFLWEIRQAVQSAWLEESTRTGKTLADLGRDLGMPMSMVKELLSGTDTIFLRHISNFYTALGREPLDNFRVTPGNGSSDR